MKAMGAAADAAGKQARDAAMEALTAQAKKAKKDKKKAAAVAAAAAAAADGGEDTGRLHRKHRPSFKKYWSQDMWKRAYHLIRDTLAGLITTAIAVFTDSVLKHKPMGSFRTDHNWTRIRHELEEAFPPDAGTEGIFDEDRLETAFNTTIKKTDPTGTRLANAHVHYGIA